MVFLHLHGVGTARAVRIYKTYGNEAITRVRENPCRLALDIQGIGFKTADTLAQWLGILRDAVIRAQAGVRHVRQEFAEDGHCAVHQDELIETAATLLEMPVAIIEQAVDLDCQEDHLISEDIDGSPASSWLHSTVLRSVSLLTSCGSSGRTSWGCIDPVKALPGLSRELAGRSHPRSGMLSPWPGSKVMVITGGPGGAKPPLSTSILQILHA